MIIQPRAHFAATQRFRRTHPPRNKPHVWFVNKPVKNDLHPTMKPVALVERAIRNSSKTRDTVLDPFGGSGSTLIACEKTGRQGRLLELDPKYVDTIIMRWQAFTQHTEIDFDLDNASPAAGAVKKKCHDIRRKVEDELGAQPYDHVHAICGADFFDDLITHPEVTTAYDRYLDGAFLRQGQARGSFEYSGIVFEEYRGRVGTVDFTDASKAYLFPVGVPGLFRQYNAPADFVETANTIGLPRYAKQAVDQQFARWVMLHVQSNPLPICTRPRVLIKGKRT